MHTHIQVHTRCYTDIIILSQQGRSNINAQAYDGNTPLHLAVAAENKNLVKLLLSVSADLNISNYDGDGQLPLDLTRPTQEVRHSVDFPSMLSF